MRGCVVSLVLFALSISATPSTNKKDGGTIIPLTKKSNLIKDGVVNIDTLKNHVTSLKHKYINSLASFEKNTGKAHPIARVDSTVRRQTSHVPLKVASEHWFGPITVGGQNFTVEFDTGSSDLFLPGPQCDTSCSGHKHFNTNVGAKDAGNSFQVQYSDDVVANGEVFTDSVTVGGLTAKTQAFGVAEQYSDDLARLWFPADGRLGMAYPEVAAITVTQPFFNTLVQEKAVSSGSFGFKLASSGSVLFLGGVDPSSSSGRLNTIPVTQKGFWQVVMDSIDVGGYLAISSQPAIIATGTPLVIGDPDDVAWLYNNFIPGAQDFSGGFFTFPCDFSPQVSMTFGGISYDISRTFNLGTDSPGSDRCVGGIVGQEIGMEVWIIGDVFLRNVYAEFSFDNNTVGFSKQK